ncbi:MAG: hypothetical protein HGA49_11895, partial [Eubacteriaceae bacterium]|nr:hypothetical protein [Eubacteriaceae bacterium]
MLKKSRKRSMIILIILVFAMGILPVTPVHAFAVISIPVEAPKYVSLGDSVSFGMNAEDDHGYTAMLKDYLDGQINITGTTQYYNLSEPGATTADLYKVVMKNQKILKDARIITINIGGNNLIKPIMSRVSELYGHPKNLNKAIKAKPKLLASYILQLSDPNSKESSTLSSSLIAGVANFVLYWPAIMNQIKTNAPDAEIYVNTVYNPVTKDQPIYALLDTCIQTINRTIKLSSWSYNDRRFVQNFRVVDIYSEFESNTKTFLDFNISKKASKVNVDLHPNDSGHDKIFQTFLNLMKIQGSAYYYDASAVKQSLAYKNTA